MIRASVANVTNSRPEVPYYVKALALGLSAYLQRFPTEWTRPAGTRF